MGKFGQGDNGGNWSVEEEPELGYSLTAWCPQLGLFLSVPPEPLKQTLPVGFQLQLGNPP